jgi:hypothetical protein
VLFPSQPIDWRWILSVWSLDLGLFQSFRLTLPVIASLNREMSIFDQKPSDLVCATMEAFKDQGSHESLIPWGAFECSDEQFRRSERHILHLSFLPVPIDRVLTIIYGFSNVPIQNLTILAFPFEKALSLIPSTNVIEKCSHKTQNSSRTWNAQWHDHEHEQKLP